MSLTIWSLNGARFVGKTALEEEPQTLTWLKSLSEPDATVPDVLCLQDFRVSLLRHLRPLPHFHFVPLSNHKIWGKRELWGLCIASRYPVTDIAVHYTWGDGIVRDVEGVGDDNHRIKPDEVADSLVMKTENRAAVACTVRKPGDPKPYRIATHHGFWVRGGRSTPEQLTSTDSLCAFLQEESLKHGGLVYAGDSNPDKDGNVLKTYELSGGRIELPPEIKTTLAAHHPAAKFGIKSDLVVQWPNRLGEYTYKVENVFTDSSPGSDHDMLHCTVI